VASLYLPHHPSVLRALARIVEAAQRHQTPVSICGDMAHQTEYIPFLIGIGVCTLSVDAMYLPKVRKAVAALSADAACRTARAVLAETSIAGIAKVLGLGTGSGSS
jgi:phosphotransferase system enzyme I (PtsP)